MSNPNAAHWTPRMIRLLGTASDGQLAKRLGLRKPQVRRKRESLGIRAFRPPAHWTRAMVKLLGKTEDLKVARKLGLTFGQVHHKRAQLGIPAYRLRHIRPWTARELALLGKDFDRNIAKKLRRTINEVCRMRQRRKIPPYEHFPRWTPKWLALLGTLSDPVLARRMRTTIAYVKNHRHRLGIVAFRTKLNRNQFPPLQRKDLKPIPGFVGYYASRGGKIYSQRGKGTLVELGLLFSKHSSLPMVNIHAGGGKHTHFSAARAVLLAWKGRPKGNANRAMVRNGNPMDNRLSNVRWATASELGFERSSRGLGRGENSGSAKLKEEEVRAIRNQYHLFPPKTLARRFGISESHVYSIVKRSVWKHI